MDRFRPLLMPLLASLTLGLAPFTPQPHLVEKIRWIFIGKSLAPIDVFDIFMHGAPWIWLGWTLVTVLRAAKVPQR